MFLSLATTHRPATDLGFLLHKHPSRVHETELPFGKAIVFYPEATETRCEAALLLDVDPIGLVRGKGRGEGLLDQYVNDRPYAASSFLSVALGRALRTAMTGTSRERPELADCEIPLEARVTPLSIRGGGEALVRSLFEPLGWSVQIEPAPAVSQDGASSYVSLRLAGTARLRALLSHLYVLIPVLDDDKHYWVGEDEVEKLLRRGEGWLESHPSRDLIVRRYLIHRRALTREALERLAPETREEALEATERPSSEDTLERPLRLNDQRLSAVADVLRASGARAIADLGCGEGKLLQHLLRERWLERLVGLDASARDLEWAAKRLKLDQPGGPPEGRVRLLHSSLTYRDRRWEDVDAAVLVEVIEHLDLDRIPALERVVFGAARPATVVVTTPNAEYNALFPNLEGGAFRHPDHRFEWTRVEFRAWAERVADAYGYRVAFDHIGEVDAAVGAPTQMAVFSQGASA
ncbi:3' terminal RNA ribose 2'-O-methyltransferase Hen1 [Phenylobacterium deserti]|uniref:Small RNA 2'-O-methyltransferase n=1 Tax=Phenylobacterium deserti TaxID=1914756 RepID=A0A328ARX4_9CAUL|nr:3' terminal RNA ribose 2'-O-methyltransferase Hen1 [Phenylobacterium deserti]RAK57011.1 3' terminal RNA ribose 2'-O-methyltransferase Hen1 [Phenylobacterium deserti]